MSNIQNFKTVKTLVDGYKERYSLNDSSRAFIYFFLDYLNPNLNSEEIADLVYDGTGDCGVDAIYIFEDEKNIFINIYNSKYTEVSKKALNNNFPASETNKVIRVWNKMFETGDVSNFSDNLRLEAKMEDIFNLIGKSDKEIKCKLYLVANQNSLTDDALNMLKSDISGCEVECVSLSKLAEIVLSKDLKPANGKLKLRKGSFFDKTELNSGVRALVGYISITDLIKLVSANPELNLRPDDFADDQELISDIKEINSFVFDRNVRNYIGDKVKINKGILKTATSEKDSSHFFYYNNGITIVCDSFKYTSGFSNPTLELNNFQIVNGQQTVHTLFNAFVSPPFNENIKNVDILLRIYATSDDDLKYNISEFTNSQNAVSDRDLKSNDEVQIKLQIELKEKGYNYERKSGEFKYQKKEFNKIISSEKAGQIILSFYLDLPDAKKRKRKIFGVDYDRIFNPDKLSADYIILPYLIYCRIEEFKRINEKEEYTFLEHATFYILYLLTKITNPSNNHEDYLNNYNKAVEILSELVANEQSLNQNKYSHSNYFNNILLKKHILEYLEK